MNDLPRPVTKLLHCCALAILGLCAGALAQAQLKIEITSGVTDPIPIAIVPFAHTNAGDGGLDVAAVVQHDLEGSGRFRAMPRARMLTNPSRVENVQLADWKADGNDYVAVGRVSPLPDGQLAAPGLPPSQQRWSGCAAPNGLVPGARIRRARPACLRAVR